MKNLNICVDIDGTVTEPYYWLSLANEYFNKNLKEEDIHVYMIHEAMGIELKDYEKFYEIYGEKIHYEAKIRIGVEEVLNKLYISNNIHFVTARDLSKERVSKLWLDKYNINRDSLTLLGSHDKVSTARELKCDLFIEDRYENAIELAAAGFPVILINTGYNQGPTPYNIYRVDNWSQISEIIGSKDYEKVIA